MTSKYKINYIEDKDLNILIREFTGSISAEILLESWEVFKNEYAHKKYKGVITDLSNTVLKLDIYSLKMVADYYERNGELFNNHLMAAVIDGPEVIIALNIEHNINNVSNKFKSFSSRKAAINWIIEN